MALDDYSAEETYATASADAERSGLGGVVRNIISLILTTLGFVISTGINVLAMVPLKPAGALADAGVAWVNGIFTSPGRAMGEGWDYMVQSLTTGNWAFFGPLTPLVIVGVALGAISMYLLWADKYDVDLPTAGNIPGIGLDDSGASEED